MCTNSTEKVIKATTTTTINETSNQSNYISSSLFYWTIIQRPNTQNNMRVWSCAKIQAELLCHHYKNLLVFISFHFVSLNSHNNNWSCCMEKLKSIIRVIDSPNTDTEYNRLHEANEWQFSFFFFANGALPVNSPFDA